MRSRIVRLSGIVLVVVMCLRILNYFNGSDQARASSPAKVYWGAIISGQIYGPGYGNAPYDLRTWNLFDSHAGKATSILSWPQAWYSNGSWQPFPTQQVNAVRQRGAIPFIAWGSWDPCCGPNESAFALRNIANGAHYSYHGETFDQYVTAWAKAAKSWGHPLFLRLDQEMNGWWQFPWATAPDPKTGVTVNNNKPADYVNAWRHVHDIFKSVGAKNITWVWCLNITSRHTTPISAVYPGDAYVDWAGLDGYNNSTLNWLSFSQLFAGSASNGYHNSYADLASFVPTKPIIIAEFASLEAKDGGAKKAAWITDALTTELPIHFPKVKAVVWFNAIGTRPQTNAYQIESSKAAQTAFATAIGAPYYASNTFASLNISPIPPLS